MISHTRQGVRFVTGTGFCVLRYHTRDRGYGLLRTLGSASCNLAYESAGVRFVTVILFCNMRNLTRDRGYDLLRPLGPASCGIIHGSLRAVGSASFDITHETGETICYVHWALQFVIAQSR